MSFDSIRPNSPQEQPSQTTLLTLFPSQKLTPDELLRLQHMTDKASANLRKAIRIQDEACHALIKGMNK